MQKYDIYMPVRILLGHGSLEELKTRPLPGKKALIVISHGGSVRLFGYLPQLQQYLKENNTEFEIFDEVNTIPIKKDVMKGASFAKETNCDFIIGFGGGSVIDCAKAIAVMAVNEGDYWDYLSENNKKKPVKALPFISVPTSLSGGSAVNNWSIILNPKTDEMAGAAWECAFPEICISDPTLMETVPSKLTACHGMDVLIQAARSQFAPFGNIAIEGLGMQVMASIYKYLPIAVKDGRNANARLQLAWADTAVGIVQTLSGSLGAHSIAYVINALHPHIPHGAVLIAICRAYFHYFEKAAPETLSKMSRAMSGKTGVDEFFISLETLLQNIGMEKTALSDFGVSAKELPTLIEHCFKTGPQGFFSAAYDMEKKDVEEILKESLNIR